MTRLPLVFHPGVEGDVAAIYDYYEQLDPALPGRFEARLDEQVERIEMFPESGAFVFESYRRVLLKRFPYMAVYLVGEDRIDVLAVVGFRRDPWLDRSHDRRASGCLSSGPASPSADTKRVSGGCGKRRSLGGSCGVAQAHTDSARCRGVSRAPDSAGQHRRRISLKS